MEGADIMEDAVILVVMAVVVVEVPEDTAAEAIVEEWFPAPISTSQGTLEATVVETLMVTVEADFLLPSLLTLHMQEEATSTHVATDILLLNVVDVEVGALVAVFNPVAVVPLKVSPLAMFLLVLLFEVADLLFPHSMLEMDKISVFKMAVIPMAVVAKNTTVVNQNRETNNIVVVKLLKVNILKLKNIVMVKSLKVTLDNKMKCKMKCVMLNNLRMTVARKMLIGCRNLVSETIGKQRVTRATKTPLTTKKKNHVWNCCLLLLLLQVKHKDKHLDNP
jgi:hypothetical protein